MGNIRQRSQKWLLYIVKLQGFYTIFTQFKKICRKIKKVVDKRVSVWYYITCRWRRRQKLKKVFKKNKKSSWQTTSSMVRCKSCWQKRTELLENEVQKVFQKNLKKFLTST